MLNVGIVLFNEVELLDFAGPFEVFSAASELYQHQLFHVFTLSEKRTVITAVNGLQIIPHYSFQHHPTIDILIIPGGVGTLREMENPAFLRWIEKNSPAAQIVFSVCSGARILGKLGMLDHLEATTHHEVIPHLKEIAPQSLIRENVRYLDQGKIMTSAGISAGIDLSLHIIEKLFGEEARLKTMRYLEYHASPAV